MPKNIESKVITKCIVCFRELKGNQTKYCSDNCKSQHYQIKKKYEELIKEKPEIKVIMWNQNDNPDGKLEWKTIKGIEHKPYKTKKNILTKKKSKTKKKSGFSFN